MFDSWYALQCKFAIFITSTMPRLSTNPAHKDKRIAKPFQGPNPHSRSQTGPSHPTKLSSNGSTWQTPEQLKRQLSRQALSKVGRPKEDVVEDDFFMVEKQQAKHIQQIDEAVTEQLRQQHLRKQNKLFEDIEESFLAGGMGDPVEYRGHTKCITAFEVTDEHIYSCSKDRSIIKWDRETKQKQFISLGKDLNHHRSDILSLSLHANQNVLATAGDDCLIKLWDTRSLALIDTLRGHKNTINGIKFGINSNHLCSVSADLTMKQWDFSQRGLIETFFEHNGQILDIDCFNGDDFITSGFDKQVVAWKTEKQTKIVFKGHDYAIDRVRAINLQRFVTTCQDGSVYLWHTRKSKPVFKHPHAHLKGWIGALDVVKQSNIFATGGVDRVVKIWAIEGEGTGLHLLKEVGVDGIVTDLKLRRDFLAVSECDQLRLGRWITDKCRNKIKIFPIRARE